MPWSFTSPWRDTGGSSPDVPLGDSDPEPDSDPDEEPDSRTSLPSSFPQPATRSRPVTTITVSSFTVGLPPVPPERIFAAVS